MARKFLTGVDNNNKRLLSVADPTSSTDGANKQYVDAAIRGIKWKDAAAASTANVSTSSFTGTSLDGVTLTSGSSVILLKDQTTGTENGLWLYNGNGSALTRAATLPGSADASGIAVTVQGGSVNDDTVFIQTADPAVVGTDDLVFSQLGGGTSYTADGSGIELTGSQFSIELDGTTLSKSASGLRVGPGAAGNGLTESTGVLAVNTGSGLEISSDAVRIATGAAGTGLTGGGGSALSIDTTLVAQKKIFSSSAAQTTTCTHSLGTTDVIVQVYDPTNYYVVECDVTNRTTSAVTVDFGTSVSSGQYKIVVIG